METTYMLTRPVEDTEFENPDISWTAKGILFFAHHRYDHNPRLTIADLRNQKPGAESFAELQSAMDELVDADLMQAV